MNDLFEKKIPCAVGFPVPTWLRLYGSCSYVFSLWSSNHLRSNPSKLSVDTVSNPMATCTETRVPQPTTLGLVTEGSQRQPAGSRVEFLADETWKLQERMPPRMSLNLIYVLLILGFCMICYFVFFFLCFLMDILLYSKSPIKTTIWGICVYFFQASHLIQI